MFKDTIYTGGYNTYGSSVGIIMLDTKSPRPPGDIGNAKTFDYPVSYEVVKGADPMRVVHKQDPELLEPFIAAADDLVERGVIAITTGCGFLLNFQRELSNIINEVPIYTSSLLQIPLVDLMINPEQQIGVLSADENYIQHLNHPILSNYKDKLLFEGLANSQAFQDTMIKQTDSKLDINQIEQDMVNAAKRLTERADIGAIIFECTNMRPYIETVQHETSLPVFDYLTLTDMVWRASQQTRY